MLMRASPPSSTPLNMLRRSILWLAVCLFVCHAHSASATGAGEVLVARQSNPQLPTFTLFSGVGSDIGSTSPETRAGLSTRSTSITSTTVTRTDPPPPSSTTVDASSSSVTSSSVSATSMPSSTSQAASASTTSSRPDGAAAAAIPLWSTLLLSVSLAAFNVV
jgi:cytoskeletal protein RodZ